MKKEISRVSEDVFRQAEFLAGTLEKLRVRAQTTTAMREIIDIALKEFKQFRHKYYYTDEYKL